MNQPVFELSLSLYIIAAIAVLGPVSMVAMDQLVSRAVARGWLERAVASPRPRVTLEDLWFMASFVILTGGLASVAQLVMFHGRAIPLDFAVHPVEMVAFTTL